MPRAWVAAGRANRRVRSPHPSVPIAPDGELYPAGPEVAAGAPDAAPGICASAASACPVRG